MPLNLHYLRIFVTVASHRSFTEAAKELLVSQPAVSKSVQELERQIGTPLLDRTGRTVDLTEAGDVLYRHAQRLFAIEREAESALAQLLEVEQGQLAVGGSHTVGTYFLPSLLGQFRRSYPKIQLSLLIGNTQQLVEDLHLVPLDLIVVEGPVSGDDVDVKPWREDHMVVITPNDSPWFTDEPIKLDLLASMPYIQRESGSGTREVVEQAFARQGISLQVALEVGSNEAAKQAVIAGLGFSVVSETAVTLERAAGMLSVVAVEGFSITRPLNQVTVTGKTPSPAVAAFQTLLDAASDTFELQVFASPSQ